jgi:hypothetical protein
MLQAARVEFRRDTLGSGNQLRQSYLWPIYGNECKNYPAVEHLHFFSAYIGNYPELETCRIRTLCQLLNGI